jgi:hypothetical protein
VYPCTECSDEALYTHCYACDTSLTAYNYAPLTHSCAPPCAGFTISINGVCTQCDVPCLYCTGTTTTCTFCISGYNYVDDGSYTCIPSALPCPAGTFKDPLNAICQICSVDCATCDSLDPNNCYSCKTGYLL